MARTAHPTRLERVSGIPEGESLTGKEIPTSEFVICTCPNLSEAKLSGYGEYKSHAREVKRGARFCCEQFDLTKRVWQQILNDRPNYAPAVESLHWLGQRQSCIIFSILEIKASWIIPI